MPHPDHSLDALRILDNLCWEEAEQTGDGWIGILRFAGERRISQNYASQQLRRLVDRGYAERRRRGQGLRHYLVYGVSDEGARRLLVEDGMIDVRFDGFESDRVRDHFCNCSTTIPNAGDYAVYATAGCPIHGATP